MTWVDWSIVAALIMWLTWMALRSSRLNQSVADFLSANRAAGKFILGVSADMANVGAVTIIWQFEMFFVAGLAVLYWDFMKTPIMLVISISGWIVYRYRQTRAFTISEFFEMRYSRNFRIFAGMITWLSGMINFGIFPAIGTRFFINFCQLQPIYIGSYNVLFPLVMLVLVGLALLFTFLGGQISVLVTDFWQGIFTTVAFSAVVIFLWMVIPWESTGAALLAVSEPGVSMVDPFDIKNAKDFNFFFFFISAFFMIYSCNAWQGDSAYKCSATTAHEAKMSKVVSLIRIAMIGFAVILMPIAAITVMHHPDYADKAASVAQSLQQAYPEDATLRTQMTVPSVLATIMPRGITGLLTAAMLAFFISTNNTYLHSWASIFVQDVVSPLRKQPLTPKQHMRFLRFSVLGVAIFIYVWSNLFPLKDYIFMYFQITGAIYMGAAGAIIIGGLYWKRGTTTAAWASMIAGSTVSACSIVLQSIWEYVPFLLSLSEEFPINGQIMAFGVALIAISVYVGVSLLGRQSIANMDKILRRGEYAFKEEAEEIRSHAHHGRINWFWRLLGVNREFSLHDRLIVLFTVCWTAWSFIAFFVLLALHVSGTMNDKQWLKWWRLHLSVNLIVGLIGAIWVIVGGSMDIKRLYRKLATLQRNDRDDGTVS